MSDETTPTPTPTPESAWDSDTSGEDGSTDSDYETGSDDTGGEQEHIAYDQQPGEDYGLAGSDGYGATDGVDGGGDHGIAGQHEAAGYDQISGLVGVQPSQHYSTSIEAIRTGAITEAHRRIDQTNVMILQAVQQFHDDASPVVTSLHGTTEVEVSGIFTALAHVIVTAAFPEAEIAAEAIKGAIDIIGEAGEKAQQDSAKNREAEAKDKLQTALNDLVFATTQAKNQLWSEMSHAVSGHINAYVAANPDLLKLTDKPDDTDWLEGYVADKVGIHDPLAGADPRADITAALWKAFNHTLAQVKEQLDEANALAQDGKLGPGMLRQEREQAAHEQEERERHEQEERAQHEREQQAIERQAREWGEMARQASEQQSGVSSATQ